MSHSDICQQLLAVWGSTHGPSIYADRDHRVLRRRMSELTNREREVFALLHTTEGNRAVAKSLHITERTVRAHVVSIHEKLRTESRLQLALLSFMIHHASDIGHEPIHIVADDNSQTA